MPELEEVLRNRLSETLRTSYGASSLLDRVELTPVVHNYLHDNPVFVFQATPQSQQASRYYFVKCFDPDKNTNAAIALEREFEMLSLLGGSERLRQQNFFVPNPIARYDDLNALVMERVEGERLSTIIRRQNVIGRSMYGTELPKLMTRCAQYLREIHVLTTIKKAPPVPQHVWYDLFERTNEIILILQQNVFSTDLFFQQGAALFKQAEMKVRPLNWPLVRVHGDYYSSNILVQEKNLYLIDFSFSKIGIGFQDLGRFLATLETINPYPENCFFSFNKIRQYQELFLSAYFADDIIRDDTARLMLCLYTIRGLVFHCMRRYRSTVPGKIKKRAYFWMVKYIYARKLAREFETLKSLL